MALQLRTAVRLLETLAPLEFAEAWDNVGLLIEPPRRTRTSDVRKLLLCIDLTEPVLEEAESRGADIVVAYHPPLFKQVRRLRASAPAERIAARALAGNVAVYSPHTALDAAPEGVNDWLADALGPGRRAPLVPALVREPFAELKVVVFVPKDSAERVRRALAREGAGLIGNYSDCSFNLEGKGTFFGLSGSDPRVGESGRLETVEEVRVEMVCAKRRLPAVTQALLEAHPYEEPAWDVYPLAEKHRPGFGMGRSVDLATPVELDEAIARIKSHLGLERVRVASAARHEAGTAIGTVAVCAGSGGAIFEQADPCDLYVTGELRHHDVLALVAQGSSVVLCDHSNTERGYLPRFAQRIDAQSGGELEVLISERDREPLRVR